MSRFQAPRGTHDVLPAEQPTWQLVTGTLAEVAEQYAYRRIQTPNFEDTEVFARTSGAGSDVVHKEMYTFLDQNNRSLTLKPEGTASIARAYIQHGMQQLPQPVKLYTLAPMYRYEAPQKGRYREHWQVSVEAFGSEDPALDAEVIDLYREVLRRLGITRYVLELNSIGDRNCRPVYLAGLYQWIQSNPDVRNHPEALRKQGASLMRIFDTKDLELLGALQDAPKIGDHLCESCRAHFAEVRHLLDLLGIKYKVNPTLVRGLDYYTRTVFEFLNPEEKAQPQICSGGRYDYLVEALGGPPTPGIGFGAGVERLLIALEHEGRTADEPGIDVFVAFESREARARVLPTIAKWRSEGLSVDTDYAGRSLKGQITQARRLGAGTVVTALDDGTYEIRRRGEEDKIVSDLKELTSS
ncbi:MAG TPA: histidine--tRNA ligase [Gaiellaceae bacterium]|nr:histidine--tRNA ligase [Gaiellaceae bacterium]